MLVIIEASMVDLNMDLCARVRIRMNSSFSSKESHSKAAWIIAAHFFRKLEGWSM